MIERYYMKEMKDIWGEKNYYRKWLEVEAAFLRARGFDSLAERVISIDIEPEEVREKEKVSGHELNSFLDIIQASVDDEVSGEIHKGLTSSDVMDTARVLQVRESLGLTEKKLRQIRDILGGLAVEHKDTFMCGRTHGQFAEVMPLGMKFARWFASASRNLERIKESGKRIFTGTLSGAVGTYSLVTPEEESRVLEMLGLTPSPAPSQVLPRDPFAEYLFINALIAESAAETALEVRLLSQDGIKEVCEPFSSGQKGSSAMPHKKNPVICERICGLARLVSSYAGTGLSNIALWNERDISHSSNERIILEESGALTYYILDRTGFVLEGLKINKNNIDKNLESAGMKLYSSAALKLLLEAGLPREEAYRKTQELFTGNQAGEIIIKKVADESGLSADKVRSALSPQGYMKNINAVYERLGLD